MIDTAQDLAHPGAYVRKHVIPQGMSVTKASTLLGIGRPALSRFLNGRAALSQQMAQRLARTFGADHEYLLSLQAGFNHREEALRVPVISGRHAPTLVEIKARQIRDWANTTAAREELPALLRRLVHTTGEQLSRVDFPAFDNSQRPGTDGVVVTAAPTPWVPNGRSVWEFGCSKRPGRKANDDYRTRVRGMPRRERRDVSFVFVTPQEWRRKKEWAAERAALGDWHDVRAYDADDLEQWLEQSAPAQVWFAERLGGNVRGFRSLDRCWSDWSEVCKPPLSSDLFSEPEDAFGNFRQWLDTLPERPFTLAADSPEEALAFACHLVDRARSETDQPGMSALVFDSPEALSQFRTASAAPRLAIVHDTETEEQIGDLYRHCHCVIVRPANDVAGKPNIRLRLPDWRKFSETLTAMGMSDAGIEQLARESGRSPAVLRRRLATLPAIRSPAWARGADVARKLIPAVFVGAWRRASPSDCEVVRRLARFDDDGDVEDAVMELLALPEPPLWSVGEHQGVVSRIDSLFGVANFVTPSDLDRFFSAAETVLSEPDPALDLPEDERWAAAMHDKVRRHSPALREGIRATLVLLAVHGPAVFRNLGNIDFEARVSSLIRRLLTPLTLDRLLSHLDDLPDYAEAAPDTFLKLIEADLQKPEPAVYGLLKPAASSPFGRCLRTTLLWALEGLGWQQLGRVSAVLARLSSVPIDDNVANTPIGSLGGLYRFWLPRTAANLAERMQSLETLTRRFPDIGWQVCIAQLEGGPGFALPSHQPRWRDDSLGAGQDRTGEAAHTFRLKAFELVRSWPNHTQATLEDLVKLLPDLPDDLHGEIWDQIHDWAREADDRAKAALRERVRRSALTRRGRRRGMKVEAVDRARMAYDRLEPNDLTARHAWLFSNSWIEPSADGFEEDLTHHQQAETIRALRISAIGEIWSEQGFDGISAFLADCGAPVPVGAALPEHVSTAEARGEFLRRCLSVAPDSAPNIDLCMRGFLGSIEDDARGQLLTSAVEGMATDRIAHLFRCAPFRQHTWRLLDRYAPVVRDRYWQEVMPDWNRYTEAELSELVDRLLNAKRPRAAFFAAHLDWPKIATPQLLRLLVDVGSAGDGSDDQYRPESHDISEAIHDLDGRGDVDPQEMIRLEFMYIQALDHSRYGIPNLERWLSESPIGFVQVLAIVFKRDDGGEDPAEWRRAHASDRAALASAALRLLERITRIPGTTASGDLDTTELSRWVTETRPALRRV